MEAIALVKDALLFYPVTPSAIYFVCGMPR